MYLILVPNLEPCLAVTGAHLQRPLVPGQRVAEFIGHLLLGNAVSFPWQRQPGKIVNLGNPEKM